MDSKLDGLRQHYANTLRKHRKNAGLSQGELASQCGLDRTYISLLERGVKTPSLHTILIIANKLNISAASQISEIEAVYKAEPKSPKD